VVEHIHNDTAPDTATALRGADWLAGLPRSQAALRFARARHAGQRREVDQTAFIAHPVEVGRLLRADGQQDEVIAAGLLHDVLEKTATTSTQLRARFGSDIARLVESVSDDSSLRDYKSRKRELRDRVAHAGPAACAVFAADKIAKVRELALLPVSQLRNRPENRAKLAHYRASLAMLRRVDGNLPLVDRLDAELSQLLARPVTVTRRAGLITSAAAATRSQPRAPTT
jgi:(p)ppGpp synthase/HD superfamily hydrolase